MDSKLKIVVLGAGGRLGAALVREYASQHEVTGFKHAQLDLARLEVLRPMLEPLPFDVLINAAALTNVDYCEDHRAEAMRKLGARNTADLVRLALLHFPG